MKHYIKNSVVFPWHIFQQHPILKNIKLLFKIILGWTLNSWYTRLKLTSVQSCSFDFYILSRKIVSWLNVLRSSSLPVDSWQSFSKCFGEKRQLTIMKGSQMMKINFQHFHHFSWNKPSENLLSINPAALSNLCSLILRNPCQVMPINWLVRFWDRFLRPFLRATIKFGSILLTSYKNGMKPKVIFESME